jgi:hypothetical protein
MSGNFIFMFPIQEFWDFGYGLLLVSIYTLGNTQPGHAYFTKYFICVYAHDRKYFTCIYTYSGTTLLASKHTVEHTCSFETPLPRKVDSSNSHSFVIS